jgi:asparagine N-glycosylation enzyme membrane subunit Stt3
VAIFLAERLLTNAKESCKVLAFPQAMKLLLALLAGLALALYILALSDGPSLLDIINRF